MNGCFVSKRDQTLANFSKTGKLPKTDHQPFWNQGILRDTDVPSLESPKTLAGLATLAGGHCENLFLIKMPHKDPGVHGLIFEFQLWPSSTTLTT